MKMSLALFSLILMSGCTTNDIQTYNQLDISDKRITVPAGGGGLVGAIKSALNKEGWELSVYRGPRVTQGSLGENTRLEEYDTYNTRYTIFVDYSQYDRKITNFEPMYHYDVSLVDNETGEEVMTMSGNDGRSTIVKKFLEALDQSS